jgi:intracellular septation protein
MQYLLELLPLALFFILYKISGIFAAVLALGALSLLGIITSLIRKKPLSKLALINSLVIIFFSSLTLFFQDSTFIKIKRTLIQGGIGLFLLIDLLLIKKFFIKLTYEKLLTKIAYPMKDNINWSKLQFMAVCFFFLLAITNEIIWRNLSEDLWVNYKIFISPLITLAFLFYQLKLIKV